MNFKKVKKAIVTFFAYVIAENLFVGFALGLVEGLNLQNSIVVNLLLILFDFLAVLIVLMLAKKEMKGQFREFTVHFREFSHKIFKTWFKGFLLMALANLIINYVIMGGIAPNEEVNRSLLETLPIYSIVNVCIFAPIVEEILFRLNFKDIAKSDKTSLILSGIIFGAMHVVTVDFSLVNLIYIIPYSILGLSFADIYFETDNIWSSITAHAFHNTLTIMVLFLGV